MNIIKIVFSLLIMMLFLTGCGMVKSSITTFHTLPAENKLTKFAFILTPKQKGSLEHHTYMRYVTEELNKHRYYLVPRNQANVYVLFDYAIDDGKMFTSSVPTYGQTGVRSSTTYGTIDSYGTLTARTSYTPTYGITGSKTVSSELFTRKLVFLILDKKTMKRIYEATVISKGSSEQIGPVMSPMIKSLFKEFPGKSGDTRREIMSR